jgi:hypothetical protein
MVKLIQVAKVRDAKGDAKLFAQVRGRLHPCRTKTQIMFYRRFTREWRNEKGEPIPHEEVYARLVNEVGYYV